ncbi:MAG: hypothetical protein ACOCXA_06735, partial [Planctomycetota bacterium]
MLKALILCCLLATATAVELQQLPIFEMPADVSVIPAADADGTVRGAPLWSAAAGGIAARLWLTHAPDGLLVRVEVDDPEQENAYHGRNLWRGDCIYISWDGRGNSLDQPIAGEDDDGLLMAGSGSEGPEAIVSTHGRQALEGARPDLLRAFRRDEAAARTSYELLIPWQLLGSAPGISTHMGLAVTVAHKNDQGDDLVLGRMRAGRDRPRQLVPFGVSKPLQPSIGMTAGQQVLLHPEDQGAVFIGVTDPAAVTLDVTIGQQTVEQALAAGWQRWRV